MYTVTVEQIIGSYAVRYKTLVPIINTEYAGSDSDTINLFIDLTSMLSNIASQPVSGSTSYNISSAIINLCAHYRNFFKEYYHVHTRIYLIISIIDSNSKIIRMHCPEYTRTIFNGTNNSKTIDMINTAIKLLETLIPFIEDIDIISTSYEFGVAVLDILRYDKEFKNNKDGVGQYPSIIITKDILTYQMTSLEGIKLLRPRKESGVDMSYMVNFNNCIQLYCQARKGTSLPPTNINPSLLSLIAALTRVPERNISAIHQLPYTLKALSKAIANNYIMNDRTIDIEYVCNTLSDKNLLKVNDIMRIRSRFCALDFVFQYQGYDAMEVNKYNGIPNMYDADAVKQINAQYFKDCPLDLNVL